MSKFKNIITSTLPGVLEHNTKESEFWRNNLQPPIIYKELSAINSVDVRDKNLVLATASTRITLFDICGIQNKKTFSSSNNVKLYSAKFRHDSSQIFLSGAGDGLVRVWDTKKSKPLRLLGQSEKSHQKKHEASVRCVNWSDVHHAFSLGDDKRIKLWDITEDSVITEFGGPEEDKLPHEDYIRGSYYSEKYQSIISGSYDHTVKVWDKRTPTKTTFDYNHGAPVESVTCRNSMIISAGDNYITLYDMIAGKEFQKIRSVHNKTITSVYNYDNYLFSASIDGYVKIYDINYVIASSISYVPSQALSCCYNGQTLAVGMVDGFVSVNQMKSTKATAKTSKIIPDDDEELEGFDFTKSLFTENRPKLDIGQNTVVVRSKLKKNKLDKHEQLLKTFQHSAALSSCLRTYRQKEPKIVVNFFQELIRRNALNKALAGRMDREVRTIIRFICQHISDCRYSRILIDVALALVNVYIGQINRSTVIQDLFKRMMFVIQKEIKSMNVLAQLTGSLEMVCNQY